MRSRQFTGGLASALLAVSLLIACSNTSGTNAHSPSQSQGSATPSVRVAGLRPSPRTQFGFAYDAARHETVLFGGRANTGAVYDTWVWNGTEWNERHSSRSPDATLDLGYDAERRLIVGFGTNAPLAEGSPSLPPGETWTWDGQTWSQVHPATNPPARRGATLTWDSKRNRLIMYGGYGRPNEGLYDTWAWDGTTWQKLADNSTDFSNLPGDAAYYPVTDTVVLYHWYGGVASDPNQRFMWTFDGVSWSRRLAVTVDLPFNGPIAYDEEIGALVLFGQHPDPQNKYSESGAATWAWNGSAWAQLATATGPQGRFYPLMVYDSARKRAVLFGGYQLVDDAPIQQNDLWEFDGSAWSQLR